MQNTCIIEEVRSVYNLFISLCNDTDIQAFRSGLIFPENYVLHVSSKSYFIFNS